LLDEVAMELVSPADLGLPFDVKEDGGSYLENARKKAREGVRLTGSPTLADDSGLEVPVLDGKPGVESAYFAGRGNYGNTAALVDALLQALGDRVKDSPAASFHCTAVLLLPDGREIVGEGVLSGSISSQRKGSHGFGFDPVFRLADGRHLAELTIEEKNLLSHRARAINALEVHGAFDLALTVRSSP
jgi:XTP/dITP diphosphohydrolase